MPPVRIFPTLLYRSHGLWKGKTFENHRYVGDVLNAIRIYNLNEVDELALLDIGATAERREISLELVEKVSTECMMPLAVGGGLKTVEHAQNLLTRGAEKLILCSHVFDNPALITDISKISGAQSVVVSVDVRRINGSYRVFSHNGTRDQELDPVTHAKAVQEAGAGEIFLNSIDRDGMNKGYDLDLIRAVSAAVSVPVIAMGGAWELEHFPKAVDAGASALSAGSMFVFYGRREAVLIHFPDKEELRAVFSDKT